MKPENNVSTHPLRFEELSDEAQERAISNYEPYTDWEWWEDSVKSWKDELEEKYGVDGVKIEWGDDFSPWFAAKVVDNEKFLETVVPEIMIKTRSPFHRIELGIDPDFWRDLWIEFQHHTGRNPSARQMTIEIEDLPDEMPDEILEEIEEKGLEFIKQKLGELGKILSSEWDYMFSREAAIDDFESMDTRFNPDGTVAEE